MVASDELCSDFSSVISALLVRLSQANSGTERQKHRMAIPQIPLSSSSSVKSARDNTSLANWAEAGVFMGEIKSGTKGGKNNGLQRITMGTKTWWDS